MPHKSLIISQKGGLRLRGITKKSSDEQPLVSIVTVVYNGVKHLEKTILSVVTQSYNNIEYIVIDGGSSDGSVEIIKKYDSEIDYWLSEPDKGIYDAMNKGIALATGDLVGIINSDDYYLEGSISKVVQACIHHDQASVFHGDIIYESMSCVPISCCSKDVLSERDIYRMPVNHPTLFIRRSVYLEFGVFDTNYKYVADYDLVLRFLVDESLTFHHLNEILVYMCGGGASSNYGLEDYWEFDEILQRRCPPFYVLLKWKTKYLSMRARMSLKKINLVNRRILPIYRRIRDRVLSKYQKISNENDRS